jgi:hypothetical protein
MYAQKDKPLTIAWTQPANDRIDGFYLRRDGGPRLDLGSIPSTETCPDGRKVYRATIQGFPAGSHTISVTAWNYKLDANEQPTTERQLSLSTTRVFTAR